MTYIMDNLIKKSMLIESSHKMATLTTIQLGILLDKPRLRNTEVNQLRHQCIPFNISFLTWRLLFRKLPFNDVMKNFGRQGRQKTPT